MSSRHPIVEMALPDEVVLPLSQHVGKPAEPVVAVGDTVLTGQMVAKATTAVSAAVHASISGSVVAIEDRLIPHSAALSAPCIVVHSDGKDKFIAPRPLLNFRGQSSESLVQAIQDAGIAGLGGAGFPSAVKLGANQPYHIHTLIVNAAECEPYITADDMLMRQYAADIVSGIEIAQHMTQADSAIIGIEDDKPDALAALKDACEGRPIDIISVPTKYPSGGEKQLIYLLTGQEVPMGSIPPDSGIVCLNVGTLVAIHQAIVVGQPLVSRVVTVTGHAVSRPGNYVVRIGSSIRHVFDTVGWDSGQMSRLVMGGPMMGFSMPSADVPVVKVTNCILAATEADLRVPDKYEMPCIRCGACEIVCPAKLMPQQLYWHIRGGELDKAKNLDLFACIECGACAYVCPSHIPLVQYYRGAKADINHLANERQLSDHARKRFDFRNVRVEKEKQARADRHKQAAAARQEASSAARSEEIQAAVSRSKNHQKSSS